MKKFRKWLIDRFLPRWAYESLLEELAAANKKQEELRQTVERQQCYISGPWRAATDYCLWPRCFRKITLGGKHDGRSDPRTDKQRSRKH